MSLLELISSESSPTADSGLDLRPNRGRPTQQGWWAPVAQCHIRESGGHGLKIRGSPSCHPTPNPSRSRGRHCQRQEAHCRRHFATTASPDSSFSTKPSNGWQHHLPLSSLLPRSNSHLYILNRNDSTHWIYTTRRSTVLTMVSRAWLFTKV
jgi:hypothetical protein